jgi:hypothetical protein
MKKFFYACAAILCLVLTYHFGATNAQGQTPSTIRFLGMHTYGPYVAAYGKVWLLKGDHWEQSPTDLPVPIDQVVSYCEPDGNTANVVSSSGEGFQSNANGPWISRGFIPGGPTPANQQTWGQVKAHYR